MSVPAPDSSLTVLHDRPVLSVSLETVAANWSMLQGIGLGAETAAVVKADGYGLGAEAVARAVKALGCQTFFVATHGEGCAVRAAVGGTPRIFVLNGLPPGGAQAFTDHGLIPCLNSLGEVREWIRESPGRPSALHVDTGMSRAGLSAEELSELSAAPDLLKRLKPALVMSHLACADEPGHAMNRRQLERFRAALAVLPAAPASLSGSGGILLGGDYRFDLTRPGIALYGGNPRADGANPVQPVMTLTATVLGVRTIQAGETAGYGASFTATGATRLAVVNIGYSDGILRSLSNRGVAYAGGVACPYAGRVSMDLLTIDVSAVPEVKRGDAVEIIGPHMTIERMAALAGTANYEVLTGLGSRFERVWA